MLEQPEERATNHWCCLLLPMLSLAVALIAHSQCEKMALRVQRKRIAMHMTAQVDLNLCVYLTEEASH
jgi:hypothetical protein